MACFPVSKLIRFSKTVSNMYADDSWDYLLAARADGTCLFAASACDHKDYTSFCRVGWGSYQRQAGYEDDSLGQVVCTWAELWATERGSWSQVQKTDKLTVTLDLDKGPYTKGEVGAFVAPTKVEDIEVAALDILVKKVPGGSFPSLPPSLLSQKVLTLTAEPSAEGLLKLICTDMGGSECANIDVDPKSQTLGKLRGSVAKKMGMEVTQVQLALTSGKLLDRVLDKSLLVELLEYGEGDVADANSEA